MLQLRADNSAPWTRHEGLTLIGMPELQSCRVRPGPFATIYVLRFTKSSDRSRTVYFWSRCTWRKKGVLEKLRISM